MLSYHIPKISANSKTSFYDRISFAPTPPLTPPFASPFAPPLSSPPNNPLLPPLQTLSSTALPGNNLSKTTTNSPSPSTTTTNT
ncbi:hypothetical protein BofuT4_P135680.1 [Botrytis cinerea T4]|uniref:Uncharacterized protein n=1 Tax=Botryotinia fuckeliana (strain T4) TaxID=999810 RepID=G2YPH5_BOTF4|nr:hypothetical protein BofuT4_P135680.1 [Botrytis cinerea T4]